MSDPMQEIRASFFIECEELLEAMQDGLQMLEDGADDGETINVVFRAVHSIKGGAGAFGLDDLVAFAHKFETALDGVRSGTIAVNDGTLKLFFQCGDALQDHVRAARDDNPLDADTHAALLASLVELSGEEAEEEVDLADFQPMTLSLDLPDVDGDDLPGLPDLGDFGAAPGSTPGWDVRFAPTSELFETGNEPLYLFRALRDLGELRVTPDVSRVPGLDELDPVAACISWTAHLVTEEPEAAIRDVFDFVADV
jgi:two-component system chemotaxis sensor kinase CheA